MQTVSFSLLASVRDTDKDTASMLQYEFGAIANIGGKDESLSVQVVLFEQYMPYAEKYAALTTHTMEAWHYANTVYAQYGVQLKRWKEAL